MSITGMIYDRATLHNYGLSQPGEGGGACFVHSIHCVAE